MDVTKGIAKAGVDIVQQIKSTNIIREESNFQKFGLSPYGHIYLVNKPSLVLGVKETFFSRREGLHVHLQSADKRNLDRKEQRWDFVIPIVKEASQEAKKSLSITVQFIRIPVAISTIQMMRSHQAHFLKQIFF
ncbi:hypothetical protein BDF20DRAFT_857953 [Mycotypha africana]|uniref:uncharacterized protein n=1 Tax=Mycotypha africana TaxID=64632 RepID=UPI002300064C|nr:uncharacterized protein BDF20DRAFT_857953 [Mycotypha africana]KAI8984102.1 hypothetical protein BDF20DRAFT_857953 [Mycotypha africana]